MSISYTRWWSERIIKCAHTVVKEEVLTEQGFTRRLSICDEDRIVYEIVHVTLSYVFSSVDKYMMFDVYEVSNEKAV
jgi:hypothetical protein